MVSIAKLAAVLKELSKVNREIDDAEAASAALVVKLDAEAKKQKQADLELRRSHTDAGCRGNEAPPEIHQRRRRRQRYHVPETGTVARSG